EYANINSYFLNLYRMLRFIYNNKELNVNNEYSGLLRSFLSKKLLVILAFHLCDRDNSYDDFIGYINEFSFLEHIDLVYLESLMLSKSIDNIGQDNIYKNILDLMFMNEVNLDDLISKLNPSRNGPVIILHETRTPELLECYKSILSVKLKGEQLDIDLLNNNFKSDFFFNSLFLAIIKRFDKKAFEGNRYIESILLHYKKYLTQETK
ncbi:TPA: hypothetical protein PWX11_001033, partial [Mannheimia haemolytica]|nr:hypothetical protein [Mannheimia haemolytica]